MKGIKSAFKKGGPLAFGILSTMFDGDDEKEPEVKPEGVNEDLVATRERERAMRDMNKARGRPVSTIMNAPSRKYGL